MMCKVMVARLLALTLAGAGLSQTAAAANSPLQIAVTHIDRQRLENGNELISVVGLVANPTDHSLSVPPIRALVRNTQGLPLYTWEIPPPVLVLEPGASASFSSSEQNIPAGGDALTLTIGEEEEHPMHLD